MSWTEKELLFFSRQGQCVCRRPVEMGRTACPKKREPGLTKILTDRITGTDEIPLEADVEREPNTPRGRANEMEVGEPSKPREPADMMMIGLKVGHW